MTTNSDLKRARRYEWNSMIANSQGNKELADRYESFAKMAMIDACSNYSNNSINTNNNSINHVSSVSTSNYDINDLKSPVCIISFILSSLFIVGVYILGGMM